MSCDVCGEYIDDEDVYDVTECCGHTVCEDCAVFLESLDRCPQCGEENEDIDDVI